MLGFTIVLSGLVCWTLIGITVLFVAEYVGHYPLPWPLRIPAALALTGLIVDITLLIICLLAWNLLLMWIDDRREVDVINWWEALVECSEWFTHDIPTLIRHGELDL
jgi:hypothetical protein